MKIQVTLQAEDLIRMRFGYSPMLEVVQSYLVWQIPECQAPYSAWIEAVSDRLTGLEFPFMDALITPYRGADFLMPVPELTVHRLDDDIALLQQTTEAKIRQQVLHILEVAPLTATRRYFLEEPHRALACFIEELVLYWECALQPYWQDMIGILDNEILRQSRTFAVNGAESMLNNLGSNSNYDGNILSFVKKGNPSSSLLKSEHILTGNGFQLVPSIFKSHSSSHIRPDKKPMILYSAHGRGLLSLEDEKPIEESLMLLVGDARARILTALIQPQHTKALAKKLHLSEGAISQQLQRLKQVGLITSQRTGYYVYYRLTYRGEQFLELFSTAS